MPFPITFLSTENIKAVYFPLRNVLWSSFWRSHNNEYGFAQKSMSSRV